MYPLGGEFYKKDNGDSTNERLMLNSGNVSGALTCTSTGVCTVTYEECIPITIMAQDVFGWHFPAASTLTNLVCISSGTVTTAPTYRLQECASTGGSCANSHASDVTCPASSPTAITSFSDSAVASGAFMKLTTSNTGVVAGQTLACLRWTTP